MKFEIDLNKLEWEQLNVILELKKKGLLKEVKDEIKEDKKEELIRQIIGKGESSKKPRKARPKADDLADKVRKIALDSKMPIPISRLAKMIGRSADRKALKKFLRKLRRMEGIDIIEKGKRGRWKYVAPKHPAHIRDSVAINADVLAKAASIVLSLKKPISRSALFKQVKGYYTMKPMLNSFVSELQKLPGIKVVGEGNRTHIGREGVVGFPPKGKRVYAPVHIDFLRKRTLWVNARAKSLIKTDVRMSWEKALSIAHMEFKNQRKKPIKPASASVDKPISHFPSIGGVEEQYKGILVGMVNRMITEGGVLDYNSCEYALNITNIAAWTDFISDFMLKSAEIAQFFNAKNKFEVVKEGGHSAVRYG